MTKLNVRKNYPMILEAWLYDDVIGKGHGSDPKYHKECLARTGCEKTERQIDGQVDR